MADEAGYHAQRWAKHFDAIDHEIARLALILEVPIIDTGVIERVLSNDPSVCGKPKSQTFEKLRALLMMHYSVRERAVVALGQQETLLIVGEIVARLRARFGDRLGGPAA